MAAVGSKTQMGFHCIHVMIISKYTFVEFLNENEIMLKNTRLQRNEHQSLKAMIIERWEMFTIMHLEGE